MRDGSDLELLFGVRAQGLEPLPWGDEARSFRVRSRGRDYHLKRILPESRETQARVRNGFWLGLMHQLRDTGVLSNVPRVVPARDGTLWARSGDSLLVLTEWIEGPPVHPQGLLPAPVRGPLARALGKLHAGTDSLALGAAPVEDYAIPFSSTLRAALEAELPDSVRRYRVRIVDELATLERAGRVAKALDAPRVLCHTDVHGGNLVLDSAGVLWLLDWEGARLAPCEQDLAGATNAHVPREQFGEFVDTYRAARGARVELHAELFEFYYRRRCLEDLDAFLRQLREGIGPSDALALVRSECLDWLDRMDDDVGFVRDALSGART